MCFCKREDYAAPGISQTDITERKTFWKRGHRETSKKRTVWSDKRLKSPLRENEADVGAKCIISPGSIRYIHENNN